jgi:hypothetical protein
VPEKRSDAIEEQKLSQHKHGLGRHEGYIGDASIIEACLCDEINEVSIIEIKYGLWRQAICFF